MDNRPLKLKTVSVFPSVIPVFSFVVIPVQTGIQEDLEVRNHLRG